MSYFGFTIEMLESLPEPPLVEGQDKYPFEAGYYQGRSETLALALIDALKEIERLEEE